VSDREQNLLSALAHELLDQREYAAEAALAQLDKEMTRLKAEVVEIAHQRKKLEEATAVGGGAPVAAGMDLLSTSSGLADPAPSPAAARSAGSTSPRNVDVGPPPPSPAKLTGYGAVVRAITDLLEQLGRWTTTAELSELLGLAPRVVADRCGFLHERGRIARRPVPPSERIGTAQYQYGAISVLPPRAQAAIAYTPARGTKVRRAATR